MVAVVDHEPGLAAIDANILTGNNPRLVRCHRLAGNAVHPAAQAAARGVCHETGAKQDRRSAKLRL